MNINYRKATKEDKQALFDMAVLFTEFNVLASGDRRRFFWDDWEQDFDDEIGTSLKDPSHVFFLAELEDGTPVGYVLARHCSDCAYYIIDELFIKAEVRGNAVGEQLLKMAIEEGKKYGEKIKAEVFMWNDAARKFYLKHGFKEDAVVLEL